MVYNYRHVMGFNGVAFSSNPSTRCLLHAVILSYVHCSNANLSHSHAEVSRIATRWQEKTIHRIQSDGRADGMQQARLIEVCTAPTYRVAGSYCCSITYTHIIRGFTRTAGSTTKL
jgi:hypothetical protein